MSTGGQGHAHRFDPVSGWCHFCNLREDGRLVSPGGSVFRAGHDYTGEELDQIRQRITKGTP
jgi:hypothetical protein